MTFGFARKFISRLESFLPIDPASKLRRYFETFGRALEQFLQLRTSSNDSIVFLLGMAFDRLVRRPTSLRERAQ